MGASSRLRTFQFLPLWEKAGYQVRVSSFFNEEYLKEVYSHRRPGIWNVLGCYWRRFLLLFSAGEYDLVWIEKEAFPFLPSYAEWILARWGKGYVVDYDDAVFHNYDRHSNWLIRNWMGNKIDWVMKNSRMVFVGNHYLRTRAVQAGSTQIELLPTVVDASRYQKKGEAEKSIFRIGWIGSPSTLKYVKLLVPALEILNTQFALELQLVNGEKGVAYAGKQVLIPWSEETEVGSILQMDIGIMPLPDDPWERGKCAYKLIQYMACGLPVVASPVGMNLEVVVHGENGFLASSVEEWVEYLRKLLEDPSLRARMGEKGRAMVLEKYTLEKNFTKLEKIVGQLIGE